MSLRQSMVCKRLRAIGLTPTVAYPIMDQVQKWVRESGEEWTVERLKSLKTALISRMADVPYELPWIRSSNGIPCGPFKPLFRMTEMSLRKKAQALNTLMMYSSFVSNGITPKQRRKFITSVLNPEPVKRQLTVDEILDSVEPLQWSYPEEEAYLPRQVQEVPWSSERFAPAGDRTVPESDVAAWLPYHFASAFSKEMWRKYPSLYKPMIKDLKKKGHFRESSAFDRGVTYPWKFAKDGFRVPRLDPGVGKVSFIQEAGYKLRAVANPDRLHQEALGPLKKKLLKVLRTIPQDCTHDQGKPLKVIQGWLGRGQEVHCVDLSDATNNFPLDLQVKLLKKTLSENWYPLIDLFTDLSRGPWKYKDEDGEDRLISWVKGQPLGLGPSFPSFALAHHALVWSSAKKAGVLPEYGRKALPYFVLGDDIVIGDRRIAESYRSALDDLGCPVSEPKCITSSLLAEFAGKVITREGVLHPFKWRTPSDRSFVDVARQLGHQSISLFRPKQQFILRKIAEVPEELGGLGWNPKGKSFEERAISPEALQLMEQAEDVVSVETPDSKLTRFVQKLVHNHRGFGLIIPPYRGPVVRSGRPDQRESVKERILRELDVPKDKTPAECPLTGYVRSDRLESDPRGATNLSVLWRKLRKTVTETPETEPSEEEAPRP